MRLFLSAEHEHKANFPFYKVWKEVEEKLQFVCKENVGLEKDTTYGTEFEDIGIISIIVPQDIKDWGLKERRLIKRKAKEADIRLYIDYERFIKETPENQRLMYIKNILDSIDVVIERSKGDFKGEKLKQDILDALEVTMEDIQSLEKKKRQFFLKDINEFMKKIFSKF